MDRVLQSTAPTIQITIRDSDGNPIDATGSVTYVVKDSAGVSLTSGTATHGAANSGIYSFVLTSVQTATLDIYTVTWSATVSSQAETFTTDFEIVGGFLFSVSDLRAFDSQLTATNYSTDAVESARAAAEERLERLCFVAFVPRGRRVTLSGDGSNDITIPDLQLRSIVSATTDSGSGAVALTSQELSDCAIFPWGLIRRKTLGNWVGGDQNVVILYTHGYDQPPEPVKRAAMALARANLVGVSLFDRTRSQVVEGGVLNYTLAGRDGYTGIPEVDAVITQFGRTKIAF